VQGPGFDPSTQEKKKERERKKGGGRERESERERERERETSASASCSGFLSYHVIIPSYKHFYLRDPICHRVFTHQN
jgi:hypothetical protein